MVAVTNEQRNAMRCDDRDRFLRPNIHIRWQGPGTNLTEIVISQRAVTPPGDPRTYTHDRGTR